MGRTWTDLEVTVSSWDFLGRPLLNSFGLCYESVDLVMQQLFGSLSMLAPPEKWLVG